MNKFLTFECLLIVLSLSACVVEPAGYYDGGPGPVPAYGYYGYGPDYPWDTGVGVDIIGGYGHGGYHGRGGYRGGSFGGGRGGGHGGGRR